MNVVTVKHNNNNYPSTTPYQTSCIRTTRTYSLCNRNFTRSPARIIFLMVSRPNACWDRLQIPVTLNEYIFKTDLDECWLIQSDNSSTLISQTVLTESQKCVGQSGGSYFQFLSSKHNFNLSLSHLNQTVISS